MHTLSELPTSYNIEFLKVTRINVTECKLVCPMHSEAKKTETSVWSREKVIAGPSKENG